MSLKRLIEQKKAKRIIDRMVQENRLPHALLFWGPRGVGKSVAAIELTRWLNCESQKDKPCGSCESCVKFPTLEHPHFKYQLPLPAKALTDSETGEMTRSGGEQLAEILGEKGRDPYQIAEFPGGQFILIGQMRSLVIWAGKRSFIDKPRVALIDHADRLREEAGNALLKLLEEPPPNFILILTAETPEDILPTLRSRCHQIEFERIKSDTIIEELRKREFADEDEINQISHLAGGSLAKALEFAQKREDILKLHDYAIDIVRRSLSKNPLEMDTLMEFWSRRNLAEQLLVLEVISAWLRDAALLKSLGKNSASQVINSDRIDLLNKFVDNCPQADFVASTHHVERARHDLEGNASAPLILLTMARSLYQTIYQKKSV